MRKLGLFTLCLVFTVAAFSADFTYTLLSKNLSGNNRYPGIAADSMGRRLAIFRSGSMARGMMYTYFEDGVWSKPAVIPRQIETDGEYLGSDIVVTSDDRFHVIWELMDEAAFYASFKDGEWSNVSEIDLGVRYEGFQVSMDVRSNDEVVTALCGRPPHLKDAFIGFLKKGETKFGNFFNMTDDRESTSSPCVAVDENDHLWVDYKGEVFGLGHEVLRTCMAHLNEENKLVDFWQPSEEQDSYAFLQWDAANRNTGVVMATWWLHGGFWSKWYDQATKKWSAIKSIGVTSGRHPDFSMWNKVVAQGKDFYCIAKDNQHIPYIVKWNGETRAWEDPIMVYDKPVVYFDIYPSDGNILIAFCTRIQPTQVFFTSMVGSYEEPKIRVKSAVNVQVGTNLERSFFSGIYINHVTWENNPYNIERGVVIDYFNLYRKLKTEAEYGSTPYQPSIPPTQLYFDDKSGIEATPLYDYYVTCVTTVDGEQKESEIEY